MSNTFIIKSDHASPSNFLPQRTDHFPRCLEMGTVGMGRKKCKCGITSPVIIPSSNFRFLLTSNILLTQTNPP